MLELGNSKLDLPLYMGYETFYCRLAVFVNQTAVVSWCIAKSQLHTLF